MLISHRHILLISALATTILASPSMAVAQRYTQNNDSMEDRLTRLESAISDLQGTVYAVDSNVQSYDSYGYADTSGGDLAIRVSELERQLQTLTGRIEELAWQLEQHTQRLDTLSAIAAGRPVDNSPNPGEGYIDRSSGYGDPYSPPASQPGEPMPVPATTGPSSLVTPAISGSATQINSADMPQTADEAYEYGFNALLNGDYTTAETSFKTFLDKWPDDPRAADAQYRLGEIYLATGADQKAARAFLQHIQTWPDDPRAAESYLKLGTAFTNLGKSEEACRIFDAATEKFTSMPLNLQARIANERIRANCPAP
ncbi:MAG: tol-pal system protein YbgF [bacterium]